MSAATFGIPTSFPTSGGGDYKPIPADNHVGLCIGVIDLGTHQESYQGGPLKWVRKLKLQFELPGVIRDDGKAAIISTTFNVSFHEKAGLRKTLDAWLGNEWIARLGGKGWDALIGTPGMINVESGPGKHDPNKTVSWIVSIGKFPKGFAPPQGSRDSFFLSLDNKRLPANLSLWDAKTIRESKEYLEGGFVDDAPRPDQPGHAGNNNNQPPGMSRDGRSLPPPPTGHALPVNTETDEDIPF